MAKPNYDYCKKCNSYSYCANRSNSVMACANFNRFPKPQADEPRK